MLEWAENQKRPITEEELQNRGMDIDWEIEEINFWGAKIYSVLVNNATDGSTRRLIRTISNGNGYEAWRRIAVQCYPKTLKGRCAVVRKIINMTKARTYK